ncbi:hypothetical protein [Gluconobacter albidus]|uniref:hypothetical protein n=1 Tax=Gluconobacter albidus TaxID=318683 RepID=UPI0011EA5493|nr:hypothetical protein [Gluconobacter albidus]
MKYKNYSCSSQAKKPEYNIPLLHDYCITGADHENKTNHCFSTFHLWRLVLKEKNGEFIEMWKDMDWVSPKEILDILITSTDNLYSGKENFASIETGEKIELEFRIAHNASCFDLSKMPGKPQK